jgi:hypothetical protein
MQLPLNVSPVSASFIGLMRPGIHLVLFLACSLSCSPLPRSVAAPTEETHRRLGEVFALRFSLASSLMLFALGTIEVLSLWLLS